jgi:8-oxo-dGTP pyrophosphatase MutT (NUDIX family)
MQVKFPSNTSIEHPTLRASATVVVIKPSFEILLMKRHPKSRFMAGLHVFPGGGCEPGEDATQAAVRELHEEVGVACVEHLTLWSRWLTPSSETKRFDTSFFIAHTHQDTPLVLQPDEVSEAAWFTPQQALESYKDGNLFLLPPTILTLEELACYGSWQAVWAEAQQRDVCAWMPKIALHEGLPTVFMPWDPLYMSLEGETLPLPQGWVPPKPVHSRMVLNDGLWRSV